jgi:hypothetical protein
MSDSNQNQYVTTINPFDVLLGRGSGPNDHEGNIRFRDMVAQRKAEYMATNHRQTKANIAKTIVDTVFSNNGRFLKKLEAAELETLGFASGMDVYQLVEEDAIMEKTKQALRQNRDKANSAPSSTMEQSANEATLAMGISAQLPHGRNSLPQVFVQGNHGNFGMPDSMTSGNHGMMGGPVPSYSVAEQPVYREDSDGYATYTTTLDDPEDDRLFDAPNRRLSTGSGPRRGSLLGGRKGEGGGRRDSLQMTDVWKASMGQAGQSMEMSELMASFKGMSTTGELNSSSDTIGTIEGDVYRNSQMSGISNMSVVSMASETSLFKTSSSDNVASSNAAAEADTFPTSNNGNSAPWNNNNGQVGCQSVNSRGSMIPREAWNSGLLQNLLSAPIEGSSTLLTLDNSGGMQRPTQLNMEQSQDSMGFLGTSSLSALRAGDLSSSSFRMPDNHTSPDRVLPPERK